MRLTIDLPPEVWHRLEAEAKAHDMSIGPYLRRLVLSRDDKKVGKQ